MSLGSTTSTSRSAPRLNNSFQKVLLEFAAAAASGIDPSSFVGLFLRSTRDLFRVSGAYFWRVTAANELVGEEACGHMSHEFSGSRLDPGESAAAAEAIRTRRTVFVNDLDSSRYPMAAEYQARSIMAAPLVVAGEVTGAIVFLHTSNARFFNEDLAAKATILAGQLGTLLEVVRLIRTSREQHRRGEILVECLQVLQAAPDVNAVLHALAERIRTMLSGHWVCVATTAGQKSFFQTISAESAELANLLAEYSEQSSAAIGAFIEVALDAQKPTVITPQVDEDELAEPGFAGTLVAAPLRTPRTQGAILIQPQENVGDDEIALLDAVVSFGELTLANAELLATANAHAQELHQLLEITTGLASISDLDQFLQKFVVRAAEFLGFDRSYVALVEGDSCRVRWIAENGTAVPLDVVFHKELAARVLAQPDAYWSDNLPNADQYSSRELQLKQILSVPLLGSDGKPMGIFGVLDRADKSGIRPEDVRRARALAAQVGVALEAAHHLHVSELHRHRSEELMAMALEMNSLVGVPEFAQKFVSRVAEMLGVRKAALAIAPQKSTLDVAAVLSPDRRPEVAELRRFALALRDVAANRSEAILAGSATELLGNQIAESLGWEEVILARLHQGDGELIGVLCLADREKPLSDADQHLLNALTGHASVALQNARLFTRMDHANRHWMEVFDAIGDFIVVHDEAQKILRVNRSLAEFIGVSPGELIGVNMQTLLAMAGDDSSKSCAFCQASTALADEYVHTVLERTYLVATSRIHAANSDSFQTVHVLKDITDRREAERRYQELFDNIQEGLFFCSPEGRFIEVNDALVRMLGYNSREELLQADASRLYASTEARDQFRAQLEKEGALRNYEETLCRRDGSPIHVLQNVFAVRDSQGRMVQFRGLMLDITELKNSQSELQRERDFNNKILNNTQSIILVTDTAGQITYANRRWYETGYQPQQFIGEPLAELVAPSRREALNEALFSTLSGQQVDNLDLAVLRGDGRMGQFSVNLSPMRDEQGEVTSIVVVMTDVTDAALLHAKLVHTEKMAAVGQLVSGVAHEVNNPLTAILGFADLLMERPEVSDHIKKDLKVILQEAQRTKQIVQNLLRFARQMPPQRKPVPLNSILRHTLQLRSYDLASHGIEVLERLCESLPEVVGDSQQLQQVFLNILNNAYDAVSTTGRPARIEVETAFDDNWVHVVFCDNGNGIENPDRIFDPFYTTKDVGKGTGLGLSICYGIVREHGGEILCHNNVGREGATFVIRLPRASGDLSQVLGTGAVEP